jgi:hypothetical protein
LSTYTWFLPDRQHSSVGIRFEKPVGQRGRLENARRKAAALRQADQVLGVVEEVVDGYPLLALGLAPTVADDSVTIGVDTGC